jgi:hypothetical protein
MAKPIPVNGVEIVAEKATQLSALDLHNVALLGIAGKPGARQALLRSAKGEIEMVQTSDLSMVGIVREIGACEARFWRAGSELVLSLPAA